MSDKSPLQQNQQLADSASNKEIETYNLSDIFTNPGTYRKKTSQARDKDIDTSPHYPLSAMRVAQSVLWIRQGATWTLYKRVG